jgi:hypothetical protein
MIRLRGPILALTALMLTSSASAAQFACSINPTVTLGMMSNGLVTVTVNNNALQVICSTDQTMYGITPGVCTAWYSTLLTWRSLNRSGTIYFDTTNAANAGFTSCTQAQPWQTHIPYFIEGN